MVNYCKIWLRYLAENIQLHQLDVHRRKVAIYAVEQTKDGHRSDRNMYGVKNKRHNR